MAFVFKSRRQGYDNIATGSATGVEFHNPGASYGEKTSREHIETLGVSADCVNSSFITARPLELPMGGIVSDANLSGHNAANPTSIVDITPTSATTPGYTSTTSFTSAIRELNTAI